MADAYVLSESDVRTLRRIAQRERGDPINHRPPVQGASHPGRLPAVRLGIAYGKLPPAEYSGGGTLVRPGKGECKMHRLRADGTAVIDLDDLPTPAYSIMPYEVADGKELLLLRDQTIEGDDENVTAPGYIALRWEPNEDTPPPVERLLYMCGSPIHTVADDDNWHQVRLTSVQNFDTATYGINAGQYAIELKRPGTYDVFCSWHLGLATGAGAGAAKVQGVMRHGSALPVISMIPCSGVLLCIVQTEQYHHDEADASVHFWIRRTAEETKWIDFAYKRNEFMSYPEIQVATLRIRYLGELNLPTVQMFTVPPPP